MSPPSQVFDHLSRHKKETPRDSAEASTMQKIRGFFTQESRRRDSKSMAFIPAKNDKGQDGSKHNPKGSPRRRNKRAGTNGEAQRRWKLVRNICFAFRIGRRCSTKVLFISIKICRNCFLVSHQFEDGGGLEVQKSTGPKLL